MFGNRNITKTGNLFGRIIVALLVVITVSSIWGGCSDSTDDRKATMESELYKTYGKSLECISIYYDNGYYKGMCCDEDGVLFDAKLHHKTMELYSDCYAERLAGLRFTEEMTGYIDGTFNECTVLAYVSGETHDDDEDIIKMIASDSFDADDFIEYTVESDGEAAFNLSYYIFVKNDGSGASDYRTEYEKLDEALGKASDELQASHNYRFPIGVRMFFVSDEQYSEITGYINNYGKIDEDWWHSIEGYPEKKYNRIIAFGYEDAPSVDEDEYIELRKEIN